MNLNATALAPEIFLSIMICVVLLVDLFARRQYSFALSIATLLVTAVILVLGADTSAATAMNGMYADDLLATVLKVCITVVSAGVFVYSRHYIADRGIAIGEFCVLGLCGVLGMMVMASASNMLLLYLGLELLALCIYAMVALQRDSVAATEAAMKYFVLGALASGVLLYGMSMIYGLTGSLDLTVIQAELAGASAATDDIVLVFAVVFVVTALCFKLGAVPFHMWIPDVYQGSPTASTLYLSAAPKLAGFALIIRLLVGGLEDLHSSWRDMLIVVALLSIVFGNVIAIAQSNIKRMLAYSTISHMGFFLLGILAGTDRGYSGALFYIIVYAFMTLAAFGVVIVAGRPANVRESVSGSIETEPVFESGTVADSAASEPAAEEIARPHPTFYDSDSLDDFRGLFQRCPWLALLMMLIMLSMAGIPPTAGFLAKMSVISAVIEIELAWVAVIAVVFAVVGAYYYLRVIWYMFFESADGRPKPLFDGDIRWVLTINAALVVVILPWIGSIMSLADTAIATMLR